MADVLKPDAALLCKLGSIAVHTKEMMSESGHEFDIAATKQLLEDPGVVEWLAGMDTMALLPKPRN